MHYSTPQKLKHVFLTEFQACYDVALVYIRHHEPKASDVRISALILAAVDYAANEGLLIESIHRQREYLHGVDNYLQRDLEDLLLSHIVDLLYPLRKDGVICVSFYDLTDSGTLAVCWDHDTVNNYHTRVKEFE